MSKPPKKAYSLKEVAREWSSKWKEDVTEEDLLSYAQEGKLTINTLITRKQFHVLNQASIEDSESRIAPNGTTWLFDTFLPLDSRWATVLIQEGAFPIDELKFNDLHLRPVGGVLRFGLKEHYVLLEDKIRFEQSITKIENHPCGTNERNTLLKQIAALSLALAEKSNRYKKGDKPNALQIAQAVEEIIDALSDTNSRGVGSSSIRENIKAGLELLTMTKQ